MTLPEIIFLIFTCFTITLIGLGFVSTKDKFYNKLSQYNFVLLGLAIFAVMGMIISGLEYSDQRAQILKNADQNSKDLINSWSCDKLGGNILLQIKGDNQTLLQYQKDLYHFKCEVKP